MKKAYQFFAWIVSIVLGLMAVLIITQINTATSVNRLVLGNKQAAATFLVNNRLEEMVNLSFELESKILTEKPPYLFKNRSGIKDSLDKLLQKAGKLEQIMLEAGFSRSLKKIVLLVNDQVVITSGILSKAGNVILLDSLRKKNFGDSIYLNSLVFQIEMEKALGATLKANNEVAEKVSWLNKLLAATAFGAILLLGTIIIRRQVTQFLLIRDLEQARKLALQSVKIKDQFLANMSHEIRTPLNALKGFSNLLSKTKLDKEQQQFSNIISSSSESLLHIVNDILDLSKIKSGAWAIKNKPFSLYALVKDIEQTYQRLAIEKKLAFALIIDQDLGDDFTGDPERLKQVLVNLISNALKFTNEGRVQLKVSLAAKQNDAASIKFEVHDTGIGIPADKQELIFERFEQIDNSFIRQQGGTGLGLAITKMIVESMGGKIQVDSEPGKGSAFSFVLNFKINSGLHVGHQKQTQHLSSFVTDPSCTTVLLAEDNKVNQLLVKKMMAPFNIHPIIVENGMDVLKLLEKQAVDLVLMDVQMPLMDGITTTRQMRANPGKQIPVVGMTAYVQPVEIEKCINAGMNECLTKPIDEEQFLAVLKKYIYLDYSLLEPILPMDKALFIDLSFLEKICNGNKETMHILLETMKAELPLDSALFENALAQKDYEALRKIAHHLKSTISPLGTDSVISESLDTLNNCLNQDNEWETVQKAGEQLLFDLKNSIELIDKKQFLS